MVLNHGIHIEVKRIQQENKFMVNTLLYSISYEVMLQSRKLSFYSHTVHLWHSWQQNRIWRNTLEAAVVAWLFTTNLKRKKKKNYSPFLQM